MSWHPDTYRINMVSMGGTCIEWMSGLTREQAQEICEDNYWIYPKDGYIWDLEIEKEED